MTSLLSVCYRVLRLLFDYVVLQGGFSGQWPIESWLMALLVPWRKISTAACCVVKSGRGMRAKQIGLLVHL